jgi:asparagine synthase (glutamine-hydrolysing)
VFHAWGDSFAEKLNGLFSGLLLDGRRSAAYLFNDRYGSERLYVCEVEGSTYFASEAKALLSVIPETRGFDDDGVAQFLSYGSTRGERTLFQNVRLLPGGSLWTFQAGGAATKRRYFTAATWEAQPAVDDQELEHRIGETLQAVMPGYLASDANVGISITGGLDTRMIMACLPAGRPNAVCYTYSGIEGDTLDARLGAQVASLCGLSHQVLRIGGDFLGDYPNYLDQTVFRTDGCAGATATHELYLARLARQLSAIRLTGNFGSEILRSMSTFKPLAMDEKLLEPEFRKDVAAARRAPESGHPVTRAAFGEIPWHLYGTVAAARSELTFRTPYLDNAIVALAYQATDHARQSPDTALSLIRQHGPSLAEIPTDRGLTADGHVVPTLARRAFSALTFKLDYLDKEGLSGWAWPMEAVRRPLTRLGLLGLHKYLPYRSWFRRELSATVKERIEDVSVQNCPYWNRERLLELPDSHRHGRQNLTQEINAVLTLEAVERLLIRPGSATSADSGVR